MPLYNPAGGSSDTGDIALDTTAGDIAALGAQAAGATGKAADAGHVHPTTGVQTAVIDSTAGDIAALGAQAAGATGKLADAGHVHPTTGLVTGVTAADTSIVAGGTSQAPTIRTATLDVIATQHPPAASVPMNSQKFTSLANGSAATDSAAFGQIPVADSTASDITQVGTAAVAGAIGKWADAGHVHSDPNPLPADFGWVAWVFDPASAVAATTPTGGTVTLAAFFLRKTTTISNIIVVVGTAGSVLTSGQNFAGIYDSSGTRQGVTADQATPWGSVGAKTMALTSAYANAPAGMYYVAVVSNGTTPPAFRGTGQIAPGNAGLAAASLRFAANGTSQTSLPATITPGSATATNAVGFCAVLS